MAVYELTLASLLELDGGRVAEAWQQGLSRIVADMEDRPGVTQARTLTLKLTAVPVVGEDGSFDTSAGRFQVVESIPMRKSKEYSFAPRRVRKEPGGPVQHQLAFNDLADDNAHQRAFDGPAAVEDEE